jgi:prepilin-type N-terminal cleavage/methylation domain-containing protein
MRAQFFVQSCHAKACVPRHGTARGFTLVELMVAMTGGLFLAVVVFALSRDAARFYQREGRAANATMSGLSGFERLSNDVARAGHLSTPNIQQDQRVCNLPQATCPAMLQRLRALVIETDPTPVNGTEVAAARLLTPAMPTPQGIVIAGALNTPEELYTASVGNSGAGWQVYLNLNTPSAARVGLSPSSAATAANLAAMQSIFMAGQTGRIIRLRWMGKDQYAVAAGVFAAPGQAWVTLAASPALQTLGAGGSQCGVDSLGTGMAVSVIDLVRYNIRKMINDPNYVALYKASGLSSGGGPSSAPFEGGRAELVRVELNAAGQEIDATREIVGEYAVDLQFSGWGATSGVNPAVIAVTNSINETYTGTQLLRGMHVRLSVRSREADRDAPIVSGTGGVTSDIYRYPLVEPVSGNTTYARVRTLQSDIPLRNLENSNW